MTTRQSSCEVKLVCWYAEELGLLVRIRVVLYVVFSVVFLGNRDNTLITAADHRRKN